MLVTILDRRLCRIDDGKGRGGGRICIGERGKPQGGLTFKREKNKKTRRVVGGDGGGFSSLPFPSPSPPPIDYNEHDEVVRRVLA